MNVLITGAKGFIGKNLVETLNRVNDVRVIQYDVDHTLIDLNNFLLECDFIYHLAGANRPVNNSDFYATNRDLVQYIVEFLIKTGRRTPILISSSIQATRDNDYGKSKLAGEQVLENYREKTGSNVFIYRLPNVFGKWCRPNYNSVIATWCYNIHNDIPIQINDPNIELQLVYIDDVVNSFVMRLSDKKSDSSYYSPSPIYRSTLGDIRNSLLKFQDNRSKLFLDDVGSGFERALYATFMSYLPESNFSYNVSVNSDPRGHFSELFKTVDKGQISVSVSRPGITRGNHYHNTKNEKFIVIKGKAVIKLRHIHSHEIIEIAASDENLCVVDIPVGYTHNISNIGTDDMVLLLWASELFDKNNPDTYYLEV